jgi:hypothetical protein
MRAGLEFIDNLISLRSLFSFASPAVADESDGSGDEEGDAGEHDKTTEVTANRLKRKDRRGARPYPDT